ncbi:MAG: Ldh family oxidoreductase [Sphingobacteriia bacterium]|nr:Ldh family oxidoreductase [Sphingobacteriia bacterium]
MGSTSNLNKPPRDIAGHWSAEALETWVKGVFLRIGCSESHAAMAAAVLLAADLKGIDSHGVARLPGYVRLWRKGRINTDPQWRWTQRMPAVALLDADGALGLVAGQVAMEKAVAMAAEFGTAQVLVRNSNHFGIAAEHALMATARGMVGWAMTNASPLVAPLGSSKRLLGTNPLCYAFPPGSNGLPWVLDMATSAAANGKLELATAAGQAIPHGWASDHRGQGTTNPKVLQEGGALLPLGSTTEGGVHKGYGLGALVDLWSGLLSGASFGPWVPPFVDFLEPAKDGPGPGLGHAFGALAVEALMGLPEYRQRLDRWTQAFAEAGLVLHGMPEWEQRCIRLREGIPYTADGRRALVDLGASLDLQAPEQ